ncbi:NDP-sugar pyrophosphorylase family protein [Ereboglobus sp. PH5-5]|uniref:nucleotidyltransferase family protein n=1 Tax=Ereboglobus sp. PH5-5 TaxID=2940529 RepID=UPI002406FF78|nr:NTP transferase domain-containing protein [Ereboglobus sp. PH5-5]MDF9832066.1 NDP-sugar pyrophosphorylase family protein [Ereboglobus sp. PH5-5]
MKPTLLVLAAGMGSRFGGLKQIAPVGPSGETLLDYSVFDAIRAGFGRVVFVIRRDFEEVFRAQVGAKYDGRIEVGYAFQAMDDLPPGFGVPSWRAKPWGTGHATWCARGEVREPFAVINADDFYGADAFRKLTGFLTAASEGEAALVGFKLSRTLSENGTVSRGMCEVSADGWLRDVVEHTKIAAAEVGGGEGKKYSGDETVSMNCWGFLPGFFDALEGQLTAFLRRDETYAEGSQDEFYLPAAVAALVGRGGLRVRAFTADSDWFGITYPADKPGVVASIRELVARGEYPGTLF